MTNGEITRLLINIPPRYMKSIAVSVMWPTWEWIRRPQTRWLFSSYSSSLSTDHSLARRMVIQSPWYQEHWGERYQLAGDQNLKTQFANTARGVMIATSVGGSATGKGGDRVVVDDPHNPEEAQSDLQREAGVRFFKQTLSTRLNDKRKGAIVVIMQRLHEEDVSAVCIEQGYTHLCLPAEAPTRQVITTPAGRVYEREPGGLLWPEREGPTEIAAAKVALGSYGYAGQYQQEPAPAEGGILKRAWWRYYRQAPSAFDEVILSWDMAFKDEEAARGGKPPDFVVGQVWGRVAADKYLLDQVRDRMDFTATCAALKAQVVKWPRARAKLVEDKANGPAVIAALRKTVPGLIPVEPQGSKTARAYAVSPDIEAGNVYLPEDAPWVGDFVEECAKFPNGANDDQVDAMTQALIRLGLGRDRTLRSY